jgi:hypothetical protein
MVTLFRAAEKLDVKSSHWIQKKIPMQYDLEHPSALRSS